VALTPAPISTISVGLVPTCVTNECLNTVGILLS